jgi:Golgi nucleoside diphosphatase
MPLSDGCYYDEYEMDSYYEELVDYLRYEIPRDLHKELQEFLLDAQGYGNWSEQADIIDRIIDHIMEGIIKDGLLEEELVS